MLKLGFMTVSSLVLRNKRERAVSNSIQKLVEAKQQNCVFQKSALHSVQKSELGDREVTTHTNRGLAS